jgi:acyl-CoA thioesterase II
VSLDALPEILRLESAGSRNYLAPHPAEDPEGRNVVFSGQLLAQMIMAADRELEGQQDVKSIHAVFSRAGSYDLPLRLETETTHAGRSFGSITVTAYQGDRLLSRGMVLLNADEPDVVRHGPARPDGPEPDDLFSDSVSKGFPGSETRTLQALDATALDGTPELAFWLRYEAVAPFAESVAVNQAILAWSQPGELIGLALRPHSAAVSIEDAHKTLSTGVIAHTIHFQERFDLSDWVLVRQSATAIGRGRVYGEGRVFDREGRLVSTFSQDSMVRKAPQGRALDPRRSL